MTPEELEKRIQEAKERGDTALYLGELGLERFPDSLGQLAQLQRLNLANNKMSELPESLLAFAQQGTLRELFLHGNDALGIPAEVLGPPWEECRPYNTNGKDPARPLDILEYYFRTRGAAARPLNEAKLILVGRGGVGKTSLVQRLVTKKKPKTQRTEGIEITNWQVTVDDARVRLNVWDFGGQEMMHATHQFFLTERSVYLLVVSNREGMAAVDVEYWLKLIESFGGDSPVLLVRNKIEETRFTLDEEMLREKYPMLRGASVATDAIEGTGCAELDARLREVLREHQDWRQPIDGVWWAIKDELEKLPQSHLGQAEFRALCDQHGEKDAGKQEIFARILKQLGVIVHYWEDPRLRETAVLKPQWLTGGIYLLLNDAKLIENRGVTRASDLARILPKKDYPKAQHTFLLEVMRKFRLCHEVREHAGTWLIPELLPEAQPAGLGTWTEADCLALRYEYAVLPEGLVPRLIAQAFPLVHEKQQWRFGVVLAMDGALARVRADRMERRVTVLVREGEAEARKKLLSYIRACFEEMHGEFDRLEVKTTFRNAGAESRWEDYNELLALENASPQELAATVYGTIDKKRVTARLDTVDVRAERVTLGPRLLPSAVGEGDEAEKLPCVPLFVSFCHVDRELKDELDVRLKVLRRRKVISHWDDGMIPDGQPFSEEILKNLRAARIILLLVSPDFMASDYITDHEVPLAMKLHKQKKATVIPIKLRACNWDDEPYAALQGPHHGKPIVGATDTKRARDEAWLVVENAIKAAAVKQRIPQARPKRTKR